MSNYQIIVYKNPETDRIVTLYPVLDCGLTLAQIAAKDVPQGVPYVFMLESELNEFMQSQHPVLFNALEVDFSNPEGQGADFGIGSYNAVDGWDQNGQPVLRLESKIQ